MYGYIAIVHYLFFICYLILYILYSPLQSVSIFLPNAPGGTGKNILSFIAIQEAYAPLEIISYVVYHKYGQNL